jgi:ribonucleotide monophosphatase NagD (HAD superfamily)
LPGVKPDRIAMCGDTLHTDILGAAARGWRTVLVTQDGLFSGHDTKTFSEQSDLFADWRLARI